MSVRAYIEEVITRQGNDGYTYYRKNHEYCFNLWRDNMFDYLLNSGANDCTNIDCCGKLYVYPETIRRLEKDIRIGRIRLTDNEKKSLSMLKKHMLNNDYVILDCY